MSCYSCLLLLSILPVALGVFIYYYINTYSFGAVEVPPKLYKDAYYGRGVVRPDDTSIKPYQYREVTDNDIQDLQNRLNRTRFNQPLEDSKDFQYGFHADYLKVVTNFWANKFDWRLQEKKIKSFNHFQTQIEGINIHFIHVKPNAKKTQRIVPLILVNGWPCNFYEYINAIEYFNNNNSDDLAYEIIIPSIPGYGFSEEPHKKGFNVAECARIFNKLMLRLNFNSYYAHGSDWGSLITRFMASMYPERVSGYHTNTPFLDFNGRFFVRLFLSKLMPSIMLDQPEVEESWLFSIPNDFFWILRESGYLHIQSTKPDTIATGLNDSPAGLVSYILEKYSTWTKDDYRLKPDGSITKKYSMDDLLTIVSIYWFNQNINYSQRFYKENFGNFDVKLPVRGVLTGITYTGNGMLKSPISFLRPLMGDLVYSNVLDDGGHFFALEDPKTFVSEIVKFIQTCEKIHRSVKL